MPMPTDRQQGIGDVCGCLYLYVLETDPERLGCCVAGFDSGRLACPQHRGFDERAYICHAS